MSPKGGPLGIGVSQSLLFDVLSGTPKSCEAVCFFFLPEARLGCGLGVASGRKTKGDETLGKPNRLQTVVGRGERGVGSTWGFWSGQGVRVGTCHLKGVPWV